MALPLEHGHCQEVLWGRLCTSLCITHAAVCFWACHSISYPAYGPICAQQVEEGCVQPLLSIGLTTEVSACGCCPGPAASLYTPPVAHLGWDVGSSPARCTPALQCSTAPSTCTKESGSLPTDVEANNVVGNACLPWMPDKGQGLSCWKILAWKSTIIIVLITSAIQ